MGILGRKKITAEFCRAKCRDCKNIDIVDRIGFRHVSPPRCSSCGGMLDKCGRAPHTPKVAVRRMLRGKKKKKKARKLRPDDPQVSADAEPVLAKLPKTADGVYVVPGMIVYKGGWHSMVRSVEVGGDGRIVSLWRNGHPDGCAAPHELSSTGPTPAEAALAALAELEALEKAKTSV